MATSKKIYITQDTEFADGVTITQNGKPIGGGDGLPVEVLSQSTIAKVYLSELYTKYPNTPFYLMSPATATSGGINTQGILTITSGTNGTYSVAGICRVGVITGNGSTGFSTIYKTGIADLTTVKLSDVCNPVAASEYNKTSAARYIQPVTFTEAHLSRSYIPLSRLTNATSTVAETIPDLDLAIDTTVTNQVLGREGQWITPSVAVSSPESRTIATPNSNYEVHGEGYYTLNCDEIVKFIKTYNKDVSIKWYQYSAIDGREYDGCLDTNFGEGLTGITCSGYDSLHNISVTLFTYNLMTNQFDYINTDFKVRLTTNSSVNTYIASLAPADAGLSPSQVKFFVQVTPGTKTSVTMDESHEMNITNAINTNIINNIPVGTKLYNHDIMGGAISDGYGGPTYQIIGGSLVSTDSTPITDYQTLIKVGRKCVYCNIEAEDQNYNLCTIVRFLWSSNITWLSLETVDFWSNINHVQFEAPTLSSDIMDTVTEL